MSSINEFREYNSSEGYDEILDEMNQTNKRLQKIGQIILILTIFGILLLVIAFMYLGVMDKYNSSESQRLELAMIFATIFITNFLMFVVVIYRFDSKRKEGNVSYEIISDLYQETDFSKRLRINAKKILGNFTNSSNLPLLPNSVSMMVYMVIHLLIVLTGVFYVFNKINL